MWAHFSDHGNPCVGRSHPISSCLKERGRPPSLRTNYQKKGFVFSPRPPNFTHTYKIVTLLTHVYVGLICIYTNVQICIAFIYTHACIYCGRRLPYYGCGRCSFIHFCVIFTVAFICTIWFIWYHTNGWKGLILMQLHQGIDVIRGEHKRYVKWW